MNTARCGQIQRTLMNREGIVKIQDNYGIFILTAVQRSPGDPIPTVGTTVHYYVDDDVLCSNNGVTIYHIKRVWLRTKPAEFLCVPQRPYVGLELARIFQGDIDASIDFIEQPVNNLVEGKICCILSDSEAVINIFDSHYAWLHIENVRNNVFKLSRLKIGQKIFFLKFRLWVSNSKASSWGVATAAWITKASVYHTKYQAKNVHNCRNSSDLAKALRAADIKSKSDAVEGARMFAKALQDVQAMLSSKGNANLGSTITSKRPEIIISTCSKQLIKAISPTEGVLVTGVTIIWIHSSHFHGKKPKEFSGIHYTAELLWQPTVIGYKYALYQSQAVWFPGNAKPTKLPNVSIQTWNGSDVSQLINSVLKHSSELLPIQIDQHFMKACELLLKFQEPWNFNCPTISEPQSSEKSHIVIASEYAPSNDIRTTSHNSSDSSDAAHAEDEPLAHTNPHSNNCSIDPSYSTENSDDVVTGTSSDDDFGGEKISEYDSDDDDIVSDSDAEETQLVATVLSKLIAKRLRSDWKTEEDGAIDDDELEDDLNTRIAGNAGIEHYGSAQAPAPERSTASNENGEMYIEYLMLTGCEELVEEENDSRLTENFLILEPASECASKPENGKGSHLVNEENEAVLLATGSNHTNSKDCSMSAGNEDAPIKVASTKCDQVCFQSCMNNGAISEEMEESRSKTVLNEFVPEKVEEYINQLKNENIKLTERMTVKLVDSHLLYQKFMNEAGVALETDDSDVTLTTHPNFKSSFSADPTLGGKSVSATTERRTKEKAKCAIF